jgi:hypothetical protein
MRLLNTNSLAFEEFHNPPPYAILSHRWTGDEVSYEDYVASTARDGPGFAKVLGCCKLARARKHRYVWVGLEIQLIAQLYHIRCSNFAKQALRLTPAVSTSAAAQSSVRPSIVCGTGIPGPRNASPI